MRSSITPAVRLAATTAAGLLVGATALTGAAPAQARAQHTVTVEEQDCRESAVTRMPVRTADLRTLVPARYGLVPGTVPGSSRTLLNTYTCTSISVDGQPTTAGGPETTVVSMWSAVVGSRDAVATPAAYLLSYATNNPVLFAKMHQSGLPAVFEPGSGVATTTSGTVTTMAFTMHGAVDYDLVSVAPEPTGVAVASTSTWYRDDVDADVQLVFHNLASPPTVSTVTADFTKFQPYASLALTSLTPSGLAGFYLRGSWTADNEPVQ